MKKVKHLFVFILLFYCVGNSFAQSRELIIQIWKVKEELKLSDESAKQAELFKEQKIEILSQIKKLETLYYQELESGSENKGLKKEILKFYVQKHQIIDAVKAEAIKNLDEALFLELLEHIRPKDLKELLKKDNLSTERIQIYKQWLESIQPTAIGSQLKNFELVDQNGSKVNTADLKGKIFWIDSWASKCGPCIKKLKQIKPTYNKYNSKGFEILAVSWDYTGGYMKTLQESKADWIKVINKQQFNWLNVFDEGDQIMGGQFGSVGKNLLIDENGIIIGFDLYPLEIEVVLKEIENKYYD